MRLIRAVKRSHWKIIRKLYENAFPNYEKKPFLLIWWKSKQGQADVWYLEENGQFIGMAITMNIPKLVLLDYFAIAENLRGKGYGTKALRILQEQYANQDFFLEIESIYDECDNAEQRIQRKQFYLRNGMTEMKMMVNLFGTNMEILGHNCKLDFESYCMVYEYSYGKRFMKNVREVPYPEKSVENY